MAALTVVVDRRCVLAQLLRVLWDLLSPGLAPSSTPLSLQVFHHAHQAVRDGGDLASVLGELVPPDGTRLNRARASTNLAEVPTNAIEVHAHVPFITHGQPPARGATLEHT